MPHYAKLTLFECYATLSGSDRVFNVCFYHIFMKMYPDEAFLNILVISKPVYVVLSDSDRVVSIVLLSM